MTKQVKKSSTSKKTKQTKVVIKHNMGLSLTRAEEIKGLLEEGSNPALIKVGFRSPVNKSMKKLKATAKAIAKAYKDSIPTTINSTIVFNNLPKKMQTTNTRKALSDSLMGLGFVNIGNKRVPNWVAV